MSEKLTERLSKRLELAKAHGPISEGREVYIPSSDLAAAVEALTAWNTRPSVREVVDVRDALLVMSKMADGYRDTGWDTYSDGYAAGRMDGASAAKSILALLSASTVEG